MEAAMRNECLAAALRELDAAGVRDIEQVNGGKHLQLRWRVNGHAALRMYSLPVTPSDWRAPRNTRAEIRRILRADGVLVVPEKVAPAPARKPDTVTRMDGLERRLGELEGLVRDVVRTMRKGEGEQQC
jgi:hypothetical protein